MTLALLIEPELTAIILTLILPLPLRAGSRLKQLLTLTRFIALRTAVLEGFLGPLLLLELPIGEEIGDLDLVRPPRRFLNKAFASEDFAFGFLDVLERDAVRGFDLVVELLLARLLDRLFDRLLDRFFARLLDLDLERALRF